MATEKELFGNQVDGFEREDENENAQRHNSDIIQPTSSDEEGKAFASQNRKNRKSKTRRSILTKSKPTDPSSTPSSKKSKTSLPNITERPIEHHNGHTGDSPTQFWSSQGISCYNDYDIDRLERQQLKLIKKLEKVEEKYEKLEEKYEKLSAENTNIKEEIETLKEESRKQSKEKVQVRTFTRSHIRCCYANLVKENKEFNLNASVNDPVNNKGICEQLKDDVMGLDPSITETEANAAISTYFNSIKYYKPKKNDENRALAKRNGRKSFKLNKRKMALEKGNFRDEHRDKAKSVLVMDFMSSESDEEDGSFSVRPLRWRSALCDNMFEKLDKFTKDKMSKNSLRQTAKRKVGLISGRGKPNNLPEGSNWAVCQEH